MKTLKTCTSGNKHKWIFQGNIVTQKSRGTGYSFTKRGTFYCQFCGQTKTGNPRSS